MKQKTFTQRTGFIVAASCLVAATGIVAVGCANPGVSAPSSASAPADNNSSSKAQVDINIAPEDSNASMPEDLHYKPDPKLTKLTLEQLLEIRSGIQGMPPGQEVLDAQMEFIERQNKTAYKLLKEGNTEEADVEWKSVYEVLDLSGESQSLPRARALILQSRYLTRAGKTEEAKETSKRASALLAECGIKGVATSMLQLQNTSDPSATEKTILAGLQATYNERRDKYFEAEKAARIQVPFYFDDFYDPDSAQLLRKYAEFLKSQGRKDEALTIEQRATLFDTKPQKLTANQLQELRTICTEDQTFEMDNSKAIQKRIDFGKSFGETSAQYMTVLSFLGLHYHRGNGEPSFYTQLYEMQKKVLGEDHPGTHDSMRQVYQELRTAKQYAKAKELAKRDLELAKKRNDGSENMQDGVQSSIHRMIEITELNQDWDELLALLKQQSDKYGKDEAVSDDDKAELKEKLSNCYFEKKDYANAELCYQFVLDHQRKERLSGSGYIGDLFPYIFRMADIETKLNKMNEADKLYKEAIAIARKKDMKESLSKYLSKYADFLKATGRAGEAVAIEKEATATTVQGMPSPF